MSDTFDALKAQKDAILAREAKSQSEMCGTDGCDWPALARTIVTPRCIKHQTPCRIVALLRERSKLREAVASWKDAALSLDAVRRTMIEDPEFAAEWAEADYEADALLEQAQKLETP